jgi:hypothetical protein
MDQPDTHRLHHTGEAVYKLDRECMKAAMERRKHTQFGHGRAPGHQLADKIGACHDDLWPDVGRVTVATVVKQDRQRLAIMRHVRDVILQVGHGIIAQDAIDRCWAR